MNATFPSPTWTQTVRDLASQFGLRPSDVLVWCVSRGLRAILEDGELLEHRSMELDPHRYKAGEMLELPWKPPDED
jgi:hypothetical protein